MRGLHPESFRTLLKINEYKEKITQVAELAAGTFTDLAQPNSVPDPNRCSSTDPQHPGFYVSQEEGYARFVISPVDFDPSPNQSIVSVLLLGTTSLIPTAEHLALLQSKLGGSGAIGAITSISPVGNPFVLYMRPNQQNAFNDPRLLDSYHRPTHFRELPNALAAIGLRSYLNSPPLQHLLPQQTRMEMALFLPSAPITITNPAATSPGHATQIRRSGVQDHSRPTRPY